MTESNANGNLSAWEQEVLVRHRWGQHGEEAYSELERLRELWKAAKPMDADCEAIIDQIIALEICNWNLEESILAICEGIGNGKAVDLAIGHLTSITDGRWREVWAYYVALRSWLAGKGPNGYSALLNILDPGKEVEDRLINMLGERNELKELYVERFCLCREPFTIGQRYLRLVFTNGLVFLDILYAPITRQGLY